MCSLTTRNVITENGITNCLDDFFKKNKSSDKSIRDKAKLESFSMVHNMVFFNAMWVSIHSHRERMRSNGYEIVWMFVPGSVYI